MTRAIHASGVVVQVNPNEAARWSTISWPMLCGGRRTLVLVAKSHDHLSRRMREGGRDVATFAVEWTRR
jgi:hypothetical protein